MPRISKVRISNFKALRDTPVLEFTEMPVIVGKNDTGKSSILQALKIFFEEKPIVADDLTVGADVKLAEIQVNFDDLSQGVKDRLGLKKLLSSTGELAVKKSFRLGSRTPEIQLCVKDFENPDFQGLYARKERELNELGQKHSLGFVKAGRSITNESKIEELAQYAKSHGQQEKDVWITPDKDVWEEVEDTLPTFTFFPSNVNLNLEQAEYQNPFQEMIVNEIELDKELSDKVQSKVSEAIKRAVEEIEANLRQQTDAIKRILPKPEFAWKKLVKIDLEVEDQCGVCVPLANRGMGIQRLVMVALLKYIAEKPSENPVSSRIFAIEEPETSLHPSAQRELIDSFRKLRERGYQIIVTSHSPVFAAEANDRDIILVTREKEKASMTQHPALNPETIVDELGILPRDQIVSYSACLFVEGPSDAIFFETMARKLKNSMRISHDFIDKKIGVIPVGGNNLKFYVEKRTLGKLHRVFAVITDSDKKSSSDQIKKRKTEWQCQCQNEGGKFYILKKRQIENYLHSDAIKRGLNRDVVIEDYNNIKEQMPSDNIVKHFGRVVEEMKTEELLMRDKYIKENGEEGHEILEIIQELLCLVN
jgi:predicted ATP-dependent endonuclease of OLD family